MISNFQKTLDLELTPGFILWIQKYLGGLIMFNFDFYNPTYIIFGKDRLESIDKYVPADATVLITYGGGSAKRSGLIDKVKTVLGNRKVYEFGGIEPNPRYETLAKAVNRKNGRYAENAGTLGLQNCKL